MIELTLKIMAETTVSTVSALWHGEKFICFVAEDGFHPAKIAGITRIPAGKYKLIKRKEGGFYSRYKQRFNHEYVIEIANVPNYKDILFHIGNFPKDTKGCLLNCDGISFNMKENFFWGTGSEEAYKRFFGYMTKYMDSEVWLKIER